MVINNPLVKHKMGCLFDQREKSLLLINGRRIKIPPAGRNDIVGGSQTPFKHKLWFVNSHIKELPKQFF